MVPHSTSALPEPQSVVPPSQAYAVPAPSTASPVLTHAKVGSQPYTVRPPISTPALPIASPETPAPRSSAPDDTSSKATLPTPTSQTTPTILSSQTNHSSPPVTAVSQEPEVEPEAKLNVGSLVPASNGITTAPEVKPNTFTAPEEPKEQVDTTPELKVSPQAKPDLQEDTKEQPQPSREPEPQPTTTKSAEPAEEVVSGPVISSVVAEELPVKGSDVVSDIHHVQVKVNFFATPRKFLAQNIAAFIPLLPFHPILC